MVCRMGRVVIYRGSWSRFIPQPAETEGMLDWKFIAQSVKNLPAMLENQVRSLGWEDLLEKEMATSVFLPGESHRQRILAGYSLWGRRNRTQLSD